MRHLFSVIAFLLSMSLVAPIASAQETSPAASGLGDLGLPTLDVTVTADAYTGIPESLEAGRYLLTVSVAEDAGEFGGGVAFVQPAGMTADEFIGFLGELAGPPDESGSGAAAATPIGDGETQAPEGAEGEDAALMLPDFIFQSTFAGGIYAQSGQSAQVVLDLTPGEWVAWGDDPTAPWTPVAFEVTGEMPTDLVEPESSATITVGEYVIEVTEGELVSGPQLIRVDNIGAQPHFVTAASTTVDVTEADVEAVLESEMTGTPASTGINFETDVTESFFSGTQSTGTSTWLPIDLAAGNLIMLCYFPDISDGLPHAYHGMYGIVEVAG